MVEPDSVAANGFCDLVRRVSIHRCGCEAEKKSVAFEEGGKFGLVPIFFQNFNLNFSRLSRLLASARPFLEVSDLP